MLKKVHFPFPFINESLYLKWGLWLPCTSKLERLLENIDIFSPVLQLKIQSHKDFIFSETEFSFFFQATLLSEIGQFITQWPAANLVYASD